MYAISHGSLLHQADVEDCFLKDPAEPWDNKTKCGYDSRYLLGMIRPVFRAGNCFCRYKVEGHGFHT